MAFAKLPLSSINTESMLTTTDLMAYARTQARIESTSYFEPGWARPEDLRGWYADRRTRDSARRRLLRDWGCRIKSGEPLVPGRYGSSGRLSITPDAIDYTPAQYAAVEIYSYLYDYMEATNNA